MIIIGVDFHPEFQQIALLNTTTGEVEEKRLAHPTRRRSITVVSRVRAKQCASAWRPVGTHAGSNVSSSSCSLSYGSATRPRSARSERQQKTDRQDAQHILKLMLKDDFPKIWVPNWQNRADAAATACGIGIAWCRRARES